MNEPVWATRVRQVELPPLEGDLSAEVCVIGLGGSGLSAVTRLLEHGADVIGIDAGPVAGGAAGRNGGLLLGGTAVPHHEAVASLGAQPAADWYRATLSEIDLMLEETPEAARRTGSLRIAVNESDAEDCDAQLAAMRASGLPAAPYAGPEGEGLHLPLDAVFNPLLRCSILADRAVSAGARLFTFSPVTDVRSGLVSTARGSVSCSRVIVAVDGLLARVLNEFEGVVRPLRLQMLATAPAAPRWPVPVYARHGYEYWQQLADGRIALGGFRDHGGEAEWTEDAQPDGIVQSLLTAYLRDTLGVLEPVTHRWAAIVGYQLNVLPVHEEARPGVFALGGYNGTGNVIGSMLGRRAADWAVTRE